MNRLKIMSLKKGESKEWLLYKHYAKRMPCITNEWGIYNEGQLLGVCVFGVPASPTLCRGICGDEYFNKVRELNRLCIDDKATHIQPNVASYFVGGCLRRLKNIHPDGLIVVSYADTAMGHIGKIYQATNFLYTGATKERTDIGGDEGTHSRHYNKDQDYSQNRRTRSSKHRYITFLGSKSQKKKMLKSLKYKVEDYPKGDSARYDASYKPASQDVFNF